MMELNERINKLEFKNLLKFEDKILSFGTSRGREVRKGTVSRDF